MQIALFGSSDLTLEVAAFLKAHAYDIAAIITAPQTFSIGYKPDGVTNVRFADMHSWGAQHQIPVVSYSTADQAISDLEALGITADFALVAGWYHRMPQKLRDLFPKGCAGFHASLLPALRGCAPLNWAILLGLKETGVSFFELSEGMDEGLLYAQEKFLIDAGDDVGHLVGKTRASILKMLGDILPLIQQGRAVQYPQVGVPSYGGNRIPEDSQIDWSKPREKILRLVRASTAPYAGAYSFFEGEKIILWGAEVASLSLYGVPGQIMVVNGAVYVMCGDGAIWVQSSDGMDVLLKSNHKRLDRP